MVVLIRQAQRPDHSLCAARRRVVGNYGIWPFFSPLLLSYPSID